MISVNLTTTSERLELCAATVWSLLMQNVAPDRINIWLSHEAYLADKGVSSIPKWVDDLNMINNIININFVNNIGPYRKIIPALREAGDSDILVYADDDVIYGATWLASLLKVFSENENKYIVASRVRYRGKNIFGGFKSYNMSKIIFNDIVLGADFIITGVGGCILMRKHIRDEFIFDDSFIQVAPKTDDIWISKIIQLSSSEVICCHEALVQVQEIVHNNNALNHSNTVFHHGTGIHKILYKIKNKILGYFGYNLSNNDYAIDEVDKYFGESKVK
ncbi:TPA: glycosyltransferase [Raoultella ornithinolytica]|nr:glycosyltransferase [Raoultella ornithinolytica]HEQ3490348.1 glycosyltransferase [Raoultella ornithinolytica]